MTRSIYAPDTLTRPDRWRADALCVTPAYKGQADLWFPNPTDVQDETEAKRVCAACPVAAACLAFALNNNVGDGIYGGLTFEERAVYRRSRAYRRGDPPNRQVQAGPRSLAEAFARRTRRTESGHLVWYGADKLKFQGAVYTALQAAFIVSHGREPEGPVRRSCGKDCYRGDHLTDGVIRWRRAAEERAAV